VTERTFAPPLPLALNARLSVMMFLQYAIWGAWLPLFWSFLTEHRGFDGKSTGYLFSIGAAGALLAPFIAGQIADRWFNTERFLAASHILGGVLVWQLGNVVSYQNFVIFGLLYSLIYAPTLPLTNSLAFHHLPDRDRDFGRVRVWGTVGWIVVGIGIGQWLLHHHTPAGAAQEIARKAQVAGMADAFKLSAILGILQGLYCLSLPATPPQPGRQAFAPFAALGEIRKSPLLALFVLSFPVACVHQFYFVHTAGFLGKLDSPLASKINTIFGVGGGGLMTIGQMAEIVVLALMPVMARKLGRKTLLAIGLAAYTIRFAVFAFVPDPVAVIPALALHGLVFGCFFFVCFMIVDENTSKDVRASAQGLFNLVIVGLGTIVGNFFSGFVFDLATKDKVTDFRMLYAVPLAVCVLCLLALVLIYPSRKPSEAAP
jgi:nucleoside transporter